MPIKTEDCKKAIVSFLSRKNINLRADNKTSELTKESNWKRTSKRGNKDKGFVRSFINYKVPGVLINIHSTEDEITEIRRSVIPILHPDSSKTSSGMIEFLRKHIIENELQEDANNLLSYLPWGKLPEVSCEFEMLDGSIGSEGETEPVDFENNEIYEITDSHMVLFAGGDWQDPVIFKAIINGDVIEWDGSPVNRVEEYSGDGYTSEQILKKLGL